MTTREWLNRGFTLSRRLAVLTATRDTLANMISRYETDGSQVDHSKNRSEDTFIRWSEAQKEIERVELELRNIDQETKGVIENVTNENERAVLTCRYVYRLAWSEVQKATGYSEQHVFKLHADGVKACGRYMDSIRTFWG